MVVRVNSKYDYYCYDPNIRVGDTVDCPGKYGGRSHWQGRVTAIFDHDTARAQLAINGPGVHSSMAKSIHGSSVALDFAVNDQTRPQAFKRIMPGTTSTTGYAPEDKNV